MQRILFIILSILAFFSVSFQVYAADTTIKQVFKVQSYSWDEENKYYKNLGHGSAVYIGNNQIITNAHVILDLKKVPTGNYNLCISNTFEKAPDCKVALKLIRYDLDKDLAILEPVSKISLGNPVKMSQEKPDIGNIVKVYGYPKNGGSTITLTEGKISGFTDGLYKVDANMDAGNSGGGAFDKNGKLVGIPSVVSVGYSTLGYIVPASTVQDFIKGKGDITKYNKTDNEFLKNIRKKNTDVLGQKINNPNISLENFKKFGFTLFDFAEKPNSQVADYIFTSKSNKTYISIDIPEIYGKEIIEDNYNISYMKKLYKNVSEKRDFKLGANEVTFMITGIGAIDSEGVVNENTYMSLIQLKNGVRITTFSVQYGADKKLIDGVPTLISKYFKIKKPFLLNTNKVITHGIITYSVIPEINIRNNLNTHEFIFKSDLPISGEITVEKSYSETSTYSNITMEGHYKTRAEYAYENYKDEDINLEIKQNTLGEYYYDSSTIDASGKFMRSSIFLAQIDDQLYEIEVAMSIPQYDTNMAKKFEELVNTVKLDGKMPFKSAKVGVLYSTKNK